MVHYIKKLKKYFHLFIISLILYSYDSYITVSQIVELGCKLYNDCEGYEYSIYSFLMTMLKVLIITILLIDLKILNPENKKYILHVAIYILIDLFLYNLFNYLLYNILT